jgi:hypothetical protein
MTDQQIVLQAGCAASVSCRAADDRSDRPPRQHPPALRAHPERLDDNALERVCAATLLLNGTRLRELAGDSATDALLQLAAETFWRN